MNPTEQHDRHTAIARLDKRIDDLAVSVDEEVAERMTQLRTLLTRLTGTDRTDRLVAELRLQRQLADVGEVLTRNAANIVTVNYFLSQFLTLPLRDRLRWTFLGKLPEQFFDITTDPESVLFPDREIIEKIAS